MLKEKLKSYNIILGSKSPRRRELLTELELDFKIKTSEKKESYPKNLRNIEIAKFIAQQKAKFISSSLSKNYLLITADTIVIKDEKIIHKPKNQDEGIKILNQLSGRTHQVITGVCIKSNTKEVVFASSTEVSFNKLSNNEIIYYLKKYKPFDKAGCYGIQEWIGHIGIKKINGTYNNVVGLPTEELYQKLKSFI